MLLRIDLDLQSFISFVYHDGRRLAGVHGVWLETVGRKVGRGIGVRFWDIGIHLEDNIRDGFARISSDYS